MWHVASNSDSITGREGQTDAQIFEYEYLLLLCVFALHLHQAASPSHLKRHDHLSKGFSSTMLASKPLTLATLLVTSVSAIFYIRGAHFYDVGQVVAQLGNAYNKSRATTMATSPTPPASTSRGKPSSSSPRTGPMPEPISRTRPAWTYCIARLVAAKADTRTSMGTSMTSRLSMSYCHGTSFSGELH